MSGRINGSLRCKRCFIDRDGEVYGLLVADSVIIRGVAHADIYARRIELQATKVRDNVVTLDRQAGQAMTVGREDLARLALQRKQASLIELEGLDEQSEYSWSYSDCSSGPTSLRASWTFSSGL